MARYLDERNHLYVSLRARGVISLWRRTNGAITQLATRSMTVTPGTWYTVRVEVVGGLTRVFVNEQLQLSSNADPGPTVPNVSWSKGQVGLITYKATADFDDFLAYQP
jgi:pectate lyase